MKTIDIIYGFALNKIFSWVGSALLLFYVFTLQQGGQIAVLNSFEKLAIGVIQSGICLWLWKDIKKTITDRETRQWLLIPIIIMSFLAMLTVVMAVASLLYIFRIALSLPV